MKPSGLPFVVLMFVGASVCAASGDVFVLQGGGQISGELVNRNESPRRHYVVEAGDGVRITLDASVVEKVLREKPVEAEYERIRPTYADTAEAQWELAQWCRQHKLNPHRETHLERGVELAPDHAEARRALGYSRIDGRWVKREEIMLQRGYVRYKGQWKLPQEIELIERKQQQDAAQQEWFLKLKQWRGWLGGDRDRVARDNLRAIDDPAAVKALDAALRDESNPHWRLLFVEALARIASPEAVRSLAEAAVFDPVEDIRLCCLDHLQKKRRPEVTSYFVGKLRDKDNQVVNLAAVGLGRMKDPASLGPLIDALITTHTFKVSRPGGDNATSASFGGGPGMSGSGMSAGGGPRLIRQHISNQAVLDALTAATGRNFGFDQRAWRQWLAAEKKLPGAIDARRD